jgi:hypothetical protein
VCPSSIGTMRWTGLVARMREEKACRQGCSLNVCRENTTRKIEEQMGDNTKLYLKEVWRKGGYGLDLF